VGHAAYSAPVTRPLFNSNRSATSANPAQIWVPC